MIESVIRDKVKDLYQNVGDIGGKIRVMEGISPTLTKDIS